MVIQNLENLKKPQKRAILDIESERGGKMRSRLNAIYWSMRTRCENSNSQTMGEKVSECVMNGKTIILLRSGLWTMVTKMI